MNTRLENTSPSFHTVPQGYALPRKITIIDQNSRTAANLNLIIDISAFFKYNLYVSLS